MAETDLRAKELALDEKDLRQSGAGKTEAGSRSQSLPPVKEMRQTCYRCDGDGFGNHGGNCPRCGGGGKEPSA